MQIFDGKSLNKLSLAATFQGVSSNTILINYEFIILSLNEKYACLIANGFQFLSK